LRCTPRIGSGVGSADNPGPRFRPEQRNCGAPYFTDRAAAIEVRGRYSPTRVAERGNSAARTVVRWIVEALDIPAVVAVLGLA
jgi:hypothetical protein